MENEVKTSPHELKMDEVEKEITQIFEKIIDDYFFKKKTKC